MRRILIERARKKSARKHGGELKRVDLDQVDIALDTDDDLLLLLNDALEEFREKDPTAAELIKLRFFVGTSLTIKPLNCSAFRKGRQALLGLCQSMALPSDAK